MPWLTDSFILTFKRMAKTWTLNLVCLDCGHGYSLQTGELHQFRLRESLEQQIIQAEARHSKECANRVPTTNGSHP